MSPETQKRANSATLIMGGTGSGKSSLLATLVEYVWETHHKLTRIVTTDGGGFPDRIEALLRMGLAQIWRARTRDLPDGSLSFETCLRASQGWWPRRWNPRTGECAPGEKLVPPITEKYVMHCPQGHQVKTVPFQSLLTPGICPTCKVPVTKQNMRVSKTAVQTAGFEQIGAMGFDGLSSMLSWMLQDMGARSGRLELKGEEGAIGGKIISGDIKLGGNTRSHVGFAQSRAEELALNALGIPNLVLPPVWTALTLEAEDKGGLSIIGPKLAGHARTDEGPSWFGNCLEAAVVKDDRDRRQYRLYLSEFVDDKGIKHLVKHRGAPGTLPAYLEDPPIEGNEAQTAFTEFNLGTFFSLLDAGLDKTVLAMKAKYPDAPGVVDGMVEVGEAVQVEQAQAEDGATGAETPAAAPTAQPATAAPAAPARPAVPKAPVRAGKPPVASKAGKPVAVAPVAPAAAVAVQEAPAAEPQAQAPAEIEPPLPLEGKAEVVQPTEPVAAPAATPAPAPPATASPAQAPARPVPPRPTTAAPGRAWAPPAAPRPPAQAPRIRPQAKPQGA